MKKITLFPYHPDMLTLTDHIDSLKGYQISGFISFREDAKRICTLNASIGRENFTYDTLLNGCDAIVLLDNYRGFKPDKYYNIIEDALRCGKEVLLTPLAQSQLDMDRYHGRYSLLENLPNGMRAVEGESEPVVEKRMYDIDIPIVAVIGQGMNCDKLKTLLLLKETLENDYETLAIASNALGALFGCFTLPSFFYENLSFQDKIVRCNQFIRLLSKENGADVLALGIPEGIAPFSKKEFNHFAEYPLIMSYALPIDMGILCTYYMRGPNLDQYITNASDFCEGKFEIPIGAAAISSTHCKVPDSESENIIFGFLDESFLHDHRPDTNGVRLPVIDLRDREKATTTIIRCLQQLQNNVRGV